MSAIGALSAGKCLTPSNTGRRPDSPFCTLSNDPVVLRNAEGWGQVVP